jgi:hypothetical protein
LSEDINPASARKPGLLQDCLFIQTTRILKLGLPPGQWAWKLVMCREVRALSCSEGHLGACQHPNTVLGGCWVNCHLTYMFALINTLIRKCCLLISVLGKRKGPFFPKPLIASFAQRLTSRLELKGNLDRKVQTDPRRVALGCDLPSCGAAGLSCCGRQAILHLHRARAQSPL